jgi:hypothetical protein
MLIKNNITRDVNTTNGQINASNSFMKGSIPNKYSPNRAKSKLSFVIGMNVWPTGIAKHTKRIIVRLGVKEAFNRSGKINYFSREQVYEKGSCEEVFILIFKRHRSICKKGKTYFNNVTMFAFSKIICLMIMRP